MKLLLELMHCLGLFLLLSLQYLLLLPPRMFFSLPYILRQLFVYRLLL